jgi:Phosphodiester glycosidase
MRRGVHRWMAASVLCALALGGAYTSASAAPDGYKVLANRRIVPGLRYIKMRNPAAPNNVFILRANLLKPIKFGVGLAAPWLGYEKTSSIAARYRAIAAVNGDFTAGWAHPQHDYAERGTFKFTASGPYRANVAVAGDESATYMGLVAPELRAWLPGSSDPVPIVKWNGREPHPGETVAFTSAIKLPDVTACSMRLLPRRHPVWSAKRQAVTRPYVVRKRACGALLDPGKGVILAATEHSVAWARFLSLSRDQRIRITWSLGWPKAWNTIGGLPILVDHGEVVAPATCGSYFCSRNPRTGIGVTANGKLLLVVVDGRSTESRGMTLVEFAKLFISLGATDALNLDGGGSSDMVVRGKVKNDPADLSGPERRVTSAVLILRQRRAETSVRATAPRRTSGGSSPLTAAFQDPGSTGGMLDALARGVFGPVELDRQSQRIVARFRQSR